MKNLLLAALVFLLHAVGASEPAAARGFYLGQQPIAVAQACNVLFNPESFQDLPGLSIVAPLSVEDTALLVQAVAPRIDWIEDAENGIWPAWMGALQLPIDGPSTQQYGSLYQYLIGCILLHKTPHLGAAELGPCNAGPDHLGGVVRIRRTMVQVLVPADDLLGRAMFERALLERALLERALIEGARLERALLMQMLFLALFQDHLSQPAA